MGTVECRVVAGSDEDFLLARHLIASGPWEEIGGVLAREATRAYGYWPQAKEPSQNRRWRRWYERHWAEELERAVGAAVALGLDPDDDRYLLDDLGGVPFDPLCSALHCPPTMSADGLGRVGRNFDMSIATLAELEGRPPHSGELPILSRPYVLEVHPSIGRGQLTMTGNTLSGCLEGINGDGLSVILMSVYDGARSGSSAVIGLDQSMLGRFVLEHCATVADALDCLRSTPHAVRGEPYHWLISDESGDGFVWEPDGLGGGMATHSEGVLRVTNHSLARGQRSDADDTSESQTRLAILLQSAATGHLDRADLDWALAAVRRTADPTSPAYREGSRTLWYTVHEPATRSIAAKFYLGDTDGGGLRLSEEITFSLRKDVVPAGE